jgi:hypothetical protein
MGKKPILLHEEKAMKDRFLSHEVAFKKSAWRIKRRQIGRF